MLCLPLFFFFFNDTATTEIYTLSLHDALPISNRAQGARPVRAEADLRSIPQHGGSAARGRRRDRELLPGDDGAPRQGRRSEEHTSELQSRPHLVCRLLLVKKKTAHSTTADLNISYHALSASFFFFF